MVITSLSNFERMSSTALSTSLIAPDTMITRSVVPGKNSLLRDNWIRAPDCDWKSVIVEPPFPITEPAAEFDTRNLTYVGFSTESESEHYVKMITKNQIYTFTYLEIKV